jgi:hypothetical protein
MRQRSDFWSAWIGAWMTGLRSMLEAQQRFLAPFLPRAPRPPAARAAPSPPPAPRAMVETAAEATAGDKPAGRGRRAKEGAAAMPGRKRRTAKRVRRRKRE